MKQYRVYFSCITVEGREEIKGEIVLLSGSSNDAKEKFYTLLDKKNVQHIYVEMINERVY